jgi:hypothetical protein
LHIQEKYINNNHNLEIINFKGNQIDERINMKIKRTKQIMIINDNILNISYGLHKLNHIQ